MPRRRNRMTSRRAPSAASPSSSSSSRTSSCCYSPSHTDGGGGRGSEADEDDDFKKRRLRRRLRPTEIGWDTDDDEELSDLVLKRRKREDGEERRRAISPVRHPPPSAPPPVLAVREDACEAKMSLRRRALAAGHFRVMVPESGRLLEDAEDFAAAAARAPRPPRYFPRPRGLRVDLDDNGNVTTRRADGVVEGGKTRYAHTTEFPGSGQRHHVVWICPGAPDIIRVDRMVKIYDMRSVQAYQVDGLSDGPGSPWFGLVDPRKTRAAGDRVSFDANLFWTVGLLFKHFGTCGVEAWDAELSAMATGPPPQYYPRPPHALPPPPYGFPPPPPPPPPSYFYPAVPPPPPRQHQQHHHQRLARTPPPPGTTTAPSSSSRGHPIPTLVSTSTPVKSDIPPLMPPGELLLPSRRPPPPARPGLIPVVASSNCCEVEIGRRYTGCVTGWRGSHGFLSCTLIPGSVLLRAAELSDGGACMSADRTPSPVGISVNFELARADSGAGFQAIRARAYV